MFLVALSTIVKFWKQSKCSRIVDWEKTMVIHTIEYYLVIRIDKIRQSSAIWIDLESLMLSKISQKEGD